MGSAVKISYPSVTQFICLACTSPCVITKSAGPVSGACRPKHLQLNALKHAKILRINQPNIVEGHSSVRSLHSLAKTPTMICMHGDRCLSQCLFWRVMLWSKSICMEKGNVSKSACKGSGCVVIYVHEALPCPRASMHVGLLISLYT